LDVQIAQNPSTPALAAAVASGTYDIAYATISTLAIAHSRGLPFVAVAPGIETIPGVIAGAIMVPAASPIKTAKDCNGKTFGAAGLGTIAEYQPRAWIDKKGGDSTTVKFIEIPFPETIAALNAGRVDAAYLVEPFITIATKNNSVRLLATGDEAIGTRFLSTVWYTTSQWANAHPDLVTRFVSAMADAASGTDSGEGTESGSGACRRSTPAVFRRRPRPRADSAVDRRHGEIREVSLIPGVESDLRPEVGIPGRERFRNVIVFCGDVDRRLNQ
jgi:NitT/TauT family transport system substrate-binding protein